MYRKRRQKRVIIFSLLLLLTMMSIGYAAFQTKVKVKGTTRITSVWDVRITNVTSGTATGSATNAITPTWTGLTANMEANLYQEGDAMEYDVTITNSGTIDAVLSDVIGTPSNSNAVIITFSGYAKGEVLHKSGVQGNTKTIHVKIEYNPEYTGGETSGEANVEFTYEQGEGGTVEPIPTPDPRYLLTYDCTTNGGAQVPEANQYYDSGTTVTLNKTCTKDGWTFVGWNTSQSATSGQSSITMNSNKTVYAIYRKEAITLTANFNANNATLSSTASQTCTIAAVYNNNIQATSCEVTAPTITGPSATPTVVGFNLAPDSNSNRNNHNNSTHKLTLTSELDNKTWYAQTMKDPVDRTITFYRNNNTNFIYNGTTYTDTSKTFTVCTIPAAYNGATQETSCAAASVTMPTITAPSNTPNLVGWSAGATNRTATYTSGQTVTNLSMTANKSYYAQTASGAAIDRKITFYRNSNTSFTYDGTTYTDTSKTFTVCTIAKTYNGTAQGTSCTVSSITMPTITAPSATPTLIGWSAGATNRTATYTSGQTVTNLSMTANKSYYAQSTAPAVTLKARWDANGATLSSTTAQTCNISATYNGTTQGTTCEVTAPTITGPSNTPNVIGFNLNSTDTTNNSAHNNSTHKLTLNTTDDTGNGRLWYAITASGEVITLKASWNANNATLSSSTPQTCTIAVSYNGTAQGTTCEVTAPTITGPSNTPNVVGFNTSANSTTNNSSYNTSTGKLTLNTTNDTGNGRTWYAITASGAAVTLKANWNANNATLSSTTAKTCTLAKTYNGTAQATTCEVDAPTITAPANTPNVIGFNTSANSTTNNSSYNTSTGKLTLSNTSDTGNGRTWYAITESGAAINRTITFYRNSNTNFIYNGTTYTDTSKTFTVCTIPKTYNGTAQASSCTVDSITMPTITAPSNTPNLIGWSAGATNRTATYTSGQTVTNLSMTANKSYYAQTASGDAINRTITFYRNSNTNFIYSGTTYTDTSKTFTVCTIAKTYNGTAQGTSCTVDSITMPTITAPSNTPTLIGWSTGASTRTATYTSGQTVTSLSMTANKTYYAQSTAEAVTLKASWNANNATLSSTTAQTCTLAATYNGTAQNTTCTVDAPTITPPANTPNVVGFNTSANSTTNNSSYNTSTGKLTLNKTSDTGNGRTWYAITASGDAITLKASWNANNATLSNSSAKTCTIAKTYNGTAQASSCTVDAPTITGPANTPNVVGFNLNATDTTNNSAHNNSTHKLTLNTTDDTGNGRTWYAITASGDAITLKASWNANNATLSSSTPQTCTLAKTYNGTAQGTTCEVTAPTITAPANTPNVVGWNTSANSTTNNSAYNTTTGKLTLNTTNDTGNGRTWYAITASGAAINRTITFYKNNNTSFTYDGTTYTDTSKTFTVCTIPKTYNGIAQATSCTVSSITMPTITAPSATPNIIGWSAGATNRTATYTSGQTVTNLSMTANMSLYAQSTAPAITLNANFNANGATLSSTESQSCDLAATFNGTAQATTCTVDAPTITRTNFTITGFNTTASATTNNSAYSSSTGKITLTSSLNNNTWYAITSYVVTINYAVGANTSAVGNTSKTCTIQNSATTCGIEMPTITPNSGYFAIGFNTGSGATKVGYKPGSTVSFSEAADGRTYYGNSAAKPSFTETLNGEVVITYPTGCGSTFTCTYKIGSGSNSTVSATTATAYVGTDATVTATAEVANTSYSGQSGTATHSSKRTKLYVSSSGNDSTGYGTLNKPYATIPKAYTSATSTSSASYIYAITNLTQSTALAANSSKTVTISSCTKSGSGASATCTYDNNKTVTKGSALNASRSITVTAGELSLYRITFDGNSIASTKGAVYVNNANAKFNVKGTAYISNFLSSGEVGAGVYLNRGTMTQTGGYIQNNSNSSSTRNGAGVYISANGTFNQSGGYIRNNTTAGHGGGVYSNGTMTMTGGTITNNTSTAKYGGGVYAGSGSTFTMSDSATISSNHATGNTSGEGGAYGGGINCAGTCNLNGGTISSNQANSGGGVDVDTNGVVTLAGATISSNTATYQSAGVHVSASTTFTFTSGSITGNTAVSGASFQYAGGIKCNGDCTMSGGSITDNNITGSSVSSSGGAIHIGVGGRFTLSGGTITGNRAHAYGDIYCSAQGTYDPKSNGTQTCGSNVPQTRSAKCL